MRVRVLRAVGQLAIVGIVVRCKRCASFSPASGRVCFDALGMLLELRPQRFARCTVCSGGAPLELHPRSVEDPTSLLRT